MLQLYHNDMSVCAEGVRLILAEKGLEYTGHHLDLRAGDQRQPEYLALNPKGKVPTLVHDGFVLTESIVIMEYIDDAFPEPAFKPATAQGRARMRGWTKQIDDGIFGSTGTVSLSIAFHHQYTAEQVEQQTQQRGPAYRKRFELIRRGVGNPAFPDAIRRLDEMLADMDKALARGPWLCGDQYTLADMAFAPYVTRLDHLHFNGMLDNRPRAADWYARMKTRKGYQEALAAWFNPKYLPLMEEKGREAWPRVKALLQG
jgi:glutathione S-transferase